MEFKKMYIISIVLIFDGTGSYTISSKLVLLLKKFRTLYIPI